MSGRVAYYGGIVKDGLVLNLDAGKKDSFNRVGTTWKDISGNGYNGTLTNFGTQTIYDLNNGGSIIFDGTNDFCNLGNSNIFDSKSITVSCFFKSTDNSNFSSMVSKKGSDLITGWELSNSGGYLRVVLRPSSGTGINEVLGGVISLNNWLQGTFTYDNILNEIRLYLNGVQVGGNYGTSPNLISNGNLYVGVRNDGTHFDPFKGNISNVILYNRALSSSEVLQNYNATKGRYNL